MSDRDDWDYESDPNAGYYAHRWLKPLVFLWEDTKILALMALLVLRWLALLCAQSTEAEMGYGWEREDGSMGERYYRLRLPGWLC